MTRFKFLHYLASMLSGFYSLKVFMANSSFCKSKSIRLAAVATAKVLTVCSFKLLVQKLIQHFLGTGHQLGRDIQWEIPISSHPYGFELFPPGNFLYGNSREIPEIQELTEFRESPIPWEFPKFPSRWKFPFSKCAILDFQSVF